MKPESGGFGASEESRLEQAGFCEKHDGHYQVDDGANGKKGTDPEIRHPPGVVRHVHGERKGGILPHGGWQGAMQGRAMRAAATERGPPGGAWERIGVRAFHGG